MFLIIVSFTKGNSISSAGRSCPAELGQWKSYSILAHVPQNWQAVPAVHQRVCALHLLLRPWKLYLGVCASAGTQVKEK